GEVKGVRKGKDSRANGVFFCNIPLMTEKGTFIINGIEKFVISQIVRAPGAYVRNESEIKLNNKKRKFSGHIVEMLPHKGTLFNFIISRDIENEEDKIVKAVFRNSTGDQAPVFPATQLLKAFGMSQDEICRIFRDDVYILNTLRKEWGSREEEKDSVLNHDKILNDIEIQGYMANQEKIREQLDRDAHGSPIDTKIKRAAIDCYDLMKKLELAKERYDAFYNENYTTFERLNKELEKASGSEKAEIQKQLNKIQEQGEKLSEQVSKIDKEIRDKKDIMIVEKAAKDIITKLAISTRSIEADTSTKKNQICYQDIITAQFMEPRKYDLSSAGRFRTMHKMHISERLYQRVLAEDILYTNGKVFLPKGTLMLKEQLDKFRDAAVNDEIKVYDEIQLRDPSKSEKKHSNIVESVLVYTDNDIMSDVTPIIGEEAKTTSTTLTLVDFICSLSYCINRTYDIGQVDDIDHLGNKHLRMIDAQLRSKLLVGLARVEKHIKDKLTSISVATANEETKAKIASKTTIRSLVNAKAFQIAVKNFFNTNQLTQFVDQQNPLSELSNKRRISAMGDGG
ncbi:MAG: hypothetical protein HUJ52_02835, partial [Malacoplasma sp.]|nr:hypothetical protein [Malacoplasma sp.]